MVRRNAAVRVPRPSSLFAAPAGREPASAPTPLAEAGRIARVPGGATPAALLGLQRAVGNRAVGALLRRGGAAGSLQRFPFTVEDRDDTLTVVVRLEGSYIRLYVHGVEAGYLRIIQYDTEWDLKDIIVHNENLRGRDLGSVLVYFFALIASSNGAKTLAVLLPNGSGLYARNGFVITPNSNPSNPPAITGDPATVRDTALGNIQGRYRITRGLPAPSQPAPRPSAAQIHNRGLINNNEGGNPAIGNDDL
jgi:hypothetical protein